MTSPRTYGRYNKNFLNLNAEGRYDLIKTLQFLRRSESQNRNTKTTRVGSGRIPVSPQVRQLKNSLDSNKDTKAKLLKLLKDNKISI